MLRFRGVPHLRPLLSLISLPRLCLKRGVLFTQHQKYQPLRPSRHLAVFPLSGGIIAFSARRCSHITLHSSCHAFPNAQCTRERRECFD